jgi:hypothetical protein
LDNGSVIFRPEPEGTPVIWTGTLKSANPAMGGCRIADVFGKTVVRIVAVEIAHERV